MSLPTEDEIMREIGLGNHYSWFNGSGSCAGIRKAAVRKLPEVLRAHDLTPHLQLVRVLERVAESEGQNGQDYLYVLTKTWQACSTAIRAHMDGDPAGAVSYVERTFLDRDPLHMALPRDIKRAAYDTKVREMKARGWACA